MISMEFKFIKYEQEGGLGVLTLNRPPVNALNGEILTEIGQLIATLKEKADLLTLIITGEGRSFVAGADISMMATVDYEEGKRIAQLGSDIFRAIEKLPFPVIAAVNGFALGGGCELALSCDIRIANEKAKFGQPEVTIGVTPGYGGTQRLPRLIGTGKAKELIYWGGIIDAEEAHRIGLVNHVFPLEGFLEAVKKFAGKFVKQAPLAVRYA
ncbi:MAG: enoyl-CoA hydratase-related protein, partial [Promethearchaeota archaeon]